MGRLGSGVAAIIKYSTKGRTVFEPCIRKQLGKPATPYIPLLLIVSGYRQSQHTTTYIALNHIIASTNEYLCKDRSIEVHVMHTHEYF